MVKKTNNTKAAKDTVKPVKKQAKKPVTPVEKEVVKPVETPPPVQQVEAATIVPQISGEFLDFMTKLQTVNAMISSLKADFRQLEKKAIRELKAAEKASQKRKRKQGNRSPSGFVKPTKISDELANFLSKDKGSEMARTEVTREINAYIREHKLQDKDNGRIIRADKKLSSLLKLKSTDELTYFNLQKYMSPHFAKSGVPLVNA
jgi:chromatin remodeling complex protein RSC6